MGVDVSWFSPGDPPPRRRPRLPERLRSGALDAGLFAAGCFEAGCFVAGCFAPECCATGCFAAGCFAAGCFAAGCFAAGRLPGGWFPTWGFGGACFADAGLFGACLACGFGADCGADLCVDRGAPSRPSRAGLDLFAEWELGRAGLAALGDGSSRYGVSCCCGGKNNSVRMYGDSRQFPHRLEMIYPPMHEPVPAVRLSGITGSGTMGTALYSSARARTFVLP